MHDTEAQFLKFHLPLSNKFDSSKMYDNRNDIKLIVTFSLVGVVRNLIVLFLIIAHLFPFFFIYPTERETHTVVFFFSNRSELD